MLSVFIIRCDRRRNIYSSIRLEFHNRPLDLTSLVRANPFISILTESKERPMRLILLVPHNRQAILLRVDENATTIFAAVQVSLALVPGAVCFLLMPRTKQSFHRIPIQIIIRLLPTCQFLPLSQHYQLLSTLFAQMFLYHLAQVDKYLLVGDAFGGDC